MNFKYCVIYFCNFIFHISRAFLQLVNEHFLYERLQSNQTRANYLYLNLQPTNARKQDDGGELASYKRFTSAGTCLFSFIVQKHYFHLEKELPSSNLVIYIF